MPGRAPDRADVSGGRPRACSPDPVARWRSRHAGKFPGAAAADPATQQAVGIMAANLVSLGLGRRSVIPMCWCRVWPQRCSRLISGSWVTISRWRSTRCAGSPFTTSTPSECRANSYATAFCLSRGPRSQACGGRRRSSTVCAQRDVGASRRWRLRDATVDDRG